MNDAIVSKLKFVASLAEHSANTAQAESFSFFREIVNNDIDRMTAALVKVKQKISDTEWYANGGD